MTKRFNIYDEYRERFYRLPKVFFTNEKYIKLPNDAKMAWAILQDRLELSRKNKWIDSKGDFFFIFTNEKLAEILNCGNTKVVELKKHLTNAELLEQIQRGQGKSNLLYLNKPDVTEDDVYKIDDSEKIGLEVNDSKEVRKTNFKKSEKRMSRSSENEHLEVRKTNTNDTDPSNTDLKDLDTIDTEDTKRDFFKTIHNSRDNSKDEEQKQKKKEEYMKKAFFENADKIPFKLADMLDTFTDTIKQAEKHYNSILIAKNKVENETNEMIWLEEEPELTQEVINAFSRSIRTIEKNKNTEEYIKKPDAYVYNAVYRVFSDEISTRQRNEQKSESDLYYNWLKESN